VRILLIIFLAVAFSSCTGYQKVLKNGTPEEKYEAAKKYYEKKEFLKAQPLFEELLGVYYGRSDREEIYYYFCYTHYALGDYLLANYHFKNFAQTYALSPKKEECIYMSAVCDYHRAMPKELDQTPTKGAINSLQSFINQYPNSEYVSDCNAKMDELRRRILEKVYSNVKLYYHLGEYKSAIVACTNALEDYPDMINREELAFIIVESNFLYAKNSITKMQKERFENTIDAVKNYNSEFGNSGSFASDVAKIKEKSNEELSILKADLQ
jgi:outer membrane protein assembly factor BamD